jgi:hypothetical protein
LPVWAKLQREVRRSFQGWDKHMDLKTLYYKTTRNIMTIWKDCEWLTWTKAAVLSSLKVSIRWILRTVAVYMTISSLVRMIRGICLLVIHATGFENFWSWSCNWYTGIMVMVSSASLLQFVYVEIIVNNEHGYLNTSYCKVERKLMSTSKDRERW